MGRGGILKNVKEIKEGIKNGSYYRTEGNELISSDGDNPETQEDRDAKNRYVTMIQGDKELRTKGVFKFWEWYTTYEGTRYYLFLNEHGKVLKVVELKELFANDMYPFFTVAAYPDLTEFWTPSPLDGVREVIMAKATAINQMLDNAESINRPMKAFTEGSVVNPLLLKYRKDGLVPMRKNVDIDKALKFFPVTPLTTSLQVYDKLDVITSTQSGVTNGARGNAEEDKVGIYEGNQANAADRFALVQDSEADGQERFAQLYLNGLKEHLNSKIAIEMIGLKGVEYTEVSKKDIRTKKDFNVVVTTAGSENTLQQKESRDKLSFIAQNKQNPLLNQKVLIESEATIAGFNIDEVKAMLDTEYGNAELMAEAARDIQQILAGKTIKPNQAANTAYSQKILDFLRDNEEHLTKKPDVVKKLFDYIGSLEPIIQRNEEKAINDTLTAEGKPTIQ